MKRTCNIRWLSYRKSTKRRITFLVIFFFISTHFPFFSIQNASAMEPEKTERDVAIFIVPKDKPDANASLLLSGIFRNELKRIKGVRTAKMVSPPPEEIGIESAEAFIMEGKRALNTLDSKGAKSSYQKAVEIIEKILPAAPRELIARAYKGLGISLLLENNIADGKRMIKRSLLLYKTQFVTEYGYRSEIKTIFMDLQKEIENSPAGAIKITTNNDPAEVYLSGEFKGFTPITISNLPEGEHFITVTKDSCYRLAQFVAVKGGLTENLTLSLDRAADGATVNSIIKKASGSLYKNEAPGELSQLRDLLKAQDLFMLSANAMKGKFVLKGFYISSEGVVKPVSEIIIQDAGLLDSVRAVLSAYLGAEIISERQEPSLETPAPGEAIALPAGTEGMGEEGIIDPNSPIFKDTITKKKEESILKKWWFWAIVTGVVGGGGVGIYMLTKSGGGVSGSTGNLNLIFHKPADAGCTP
jgi:tetratricopeptide (TPR) repeat protein